MYKIAAVGDKDSLVAFRALGIEVFSAYESKATRVLIDRLAKEDYGMIFITENLVKMVPETIQRYKAKLIPAIIPIPNNSGSLGIGMSEINKNVEKAVGSNIFANK